MMFFSRRLARAFSYSIKQTTSVVNNVPKTTLVPRLALGAGVAALAYSSSPSKETAICSNAPAITLRTELYPKLPVNSTGKLKVSGGHEIYYEESGNPTGKPVIVVHGGPGGGSNPGYRQFFDPTKYRIIQFDQRGSGNSTPHASLENNTTWDLVQDMERLRKHLKLECWQVFGGSWGSTLSLAYSVKHPDRVTELILRGVFMLRRKELKWFYQEGASFLYPDEWEAYRDHIPEAERGDFISAYHRRLTSPDPEVRLAAARVWTRWEKRTSTLIQPALTETEDKYALAFARIENHYFKHEGFFESETYLLDGVQELRRRGVPCVIAQGRYDVVCPMETAWDLHRAWPEAKLHIVGDAGHSCFERGTAEKLVEATDSFKSR